MPIFPCSRADLVDDVISPIWAQEYEPLVAAIDNMTVLAFESETPRRIGCWIGDLVRGSDRLSGAHGKTHKEIRSFRSATFPDASEEIKGKHSAANETRTPIRIDPCP